MTPPDPPALRAALALSAALPALPRALGARAHRRQGADPARLPERLGRATRPRPPGRLVWVHAASAGEVAAARDLARDLAAEAGAALLMTTTTQAGAGAVPAGALHQFAPVDNPAAVRGFLDHWRPDLGVFVEADLWPRLVIAAAARMPLALLGARASRMRARWPRASAALLARFRLITAQDEDVAAGLGALGVRAEAVGDLRADAAPLLFDAAEFAQISGRLGGRPAWVALSTHAGDERPVLQAVAALRAAQPRALLLWLPRHPARAEAIAAAAGPLPRRSRGEGPGPGPIWLWDTLGEAGLALRLAGLAFLGGAFGPEGGHNPWEPARLGCAVLSGPGVANHRSGFARLAAAGGAEIVADGEALGAAVARLLGTAAGAAMGAAAAAAAASAGGARARSLALLRPLWAAP